MESINKEKDTKKKRLIAIIIAAFLICAGVTGFFIFQSRYTALSIRLQRLVGVVNLYDKNGSERSLVEKMRLNSGNKLTTATESLVTVALDNTKLLTMEEASKAQVNKRGKKLKFDLLEGNLFFNVTEKLGKKESFEIKTSTMAVGIRGTSAYVGMDFSGHEMVMVTDGTVHVVAENPRTGEKIETDVPAGMKIVIFLDDEAEGDATISFIMEPFKEEDLPAMALDTIHKNKKLRERVLKATGFREDKLERLYELNTTEGESMVGEAKEELSELGLDDAIPFMGDKVRYMVEAANDAVVIAEEDLDLEVAIIKGLEDTSDVAVEGGLEKEEVVSVIHTTSGVIGNLIVQAKENDLDDEAIIMVADNVSGAVTVAVKDMIVGDLSVDEIEGVVDTIGTVFGIAIDNGANEGPKAIIENVEDAYKFVKDTVNDEMNKNSNGEETSEALLRRKPGTEENEKIAKEDNAEEKNTSNDRNTSVSTNASNTSNETNIANTANSDDNTASGSTDDPQNGNDTETSDNTVSTSENTTQTEASNSGNTNESPVSQVVNTVKKYLIKWFASDDEYAKNEAVSSSEIEENTAVSAPSNPVKAASEYFTYVFRKWKAFFKGDDGAYTEAGEYAANEIPAATKDANYVAQYDQSNRVYGVTLEKDGGVINGTDVTSYTYGTAVNLPNDVTKTEDSMYTYRFKGWSVNNASFSQIRTISNTETGDKTYYAFYDKTAKAYAVNISGLGNLSGGSVSVKNSANTELTNGASVGQADYGTTVTVKATPNTGYSLGTFTVSVTGSTSGSSVTVEGTGDTRTFTMPAEAVNVSVTVTFGKAVTGVELNTTKISINPGDTYDLIATIAPTDATDKRVEWSTTDSSVATVEALPSQGGTIAARVTGVAPGTVTITVTTTDGAKTAECAIKVLDATCPTIDRDKFRTQIENMSSCTKFEHKNYSEVSSSILNSSSTKKVQEGDSEPYIYVWQNTTEQAMYWTCAKDYVYLPTNSSQLFSRDNNNRYTSFTQIDLSCMDTSKVTNMYAMFKNAKSVTSLDCSGFDTTRVTTMSTMFYECNNLMTVDLSSFDTKSVTSMYSMFYGCHNLSNIDLSSFNTANVRSFDQMFYYCINLTQIDISSFSTDSATDMNHMFSHCEKIAVVNLGAFNTSNVTNFAYVFEDCKELVTIYSENSWVTSQVTNGQMRWYTFSGCTKLKGGNGSAYSNAADSACDKAVIDGEAGLSGFFTAKSAAIIGNSSITASELQTQLNSATNGITLNKTNTGGNLCLDDDLTVPAGKTLIVERGVTVVVPEGKVLTVEASGVLVNYGTLTVETGATFANNGTYRNYSGHTTNNHGVIIVGVNGTFVNGDGYDNDGRLNNFDGAEIINNGTIINNTGSVINNDGDIEGNIITGMGEINDNSASDEESDPTTNDTESIDGEAMTTDNTADTSKNDDDSGESDKEDRDINDEAEQIPGDAMNTPTQGADEEPDTSQTGQSDDNDHKAEEEEGEGEGGADTGDEESKDANVDDAALPDENEELSE